MHRPFHRSLLSFALFLAASAPLLAGFNRDSGDGAMVTLTGNVPAFARAALDRGATDPELHLNRMILLLRPRAGGEESLQRLLAEQQNPASGFYHQWLTPSEFGARFGAADADIKAVTSWLRSKGFVVGSLAAGRGTLHFSGRVATVERAFDTSIHDLEVKGKIFHSNVTDPSIPAALAGVVRGVASLNNYPRSSFAAIQPETNLRGGSHGLSPADFATIYNTRTLYDRGIDGRSQSIAVVGRSNIRPGDVQYFRQHFGLPQNDPSVLINGSDPGTSDSGEETEADLDVEWAGAVAPAAKIMLVTSKSTFSTDGVDLSAEYVVNSNLAPVMTTSFGLCEDDLGATGRALYSSLWAQAAAQGITALVSSGDSGAAGCDSPSAARATGLAVSGLASTPYNVAVGGTQFMDDANPTAFWSAAADAVTSASAISYIPEQAWNETISGGLWGSGGGVSAYYSKPAWQQGPGVPGDGARDVPDVSLSAAQHDGYLVIQGHSSLTTGMLLVGGTSAATPAFAGLMALVVQQTGERQGNANGVLYRLAAGQAVGGSPVFHDVVEGDNGAPGMPGYRAAPGYDLVTGLGSVDAAAMVLNWGAIAPRARVTRHRAASRH